MNKLAYESKEFGKRLTNIDDSRTSGTTAWSSSKITNELNAHTQIDDSSTSTSKTWSSSKINSEISPMVDEATITQYQASDKSLSFKKDIVTVKDTGDKVIWQAPCINICKSNKKIYKSLNLSSFFDSGISTNLEWKTNGGFDSVFDVNGFYYFIGVVNGNLVVYKTKDFITFESTSVTSLSSLGQYCKFYMYKCCLIIGNKLALFYGNSKFILLDFESETYTVTEVGTELKASSASFAGRLAYFKGSWYVAKEINISEISGEPDYRLVLFKSSDNGVTWSRISIEGTDTFSNSNDYTFNVSIQGDELIFITYTKAYSTSDGNTWTSFTSTDSVRLNRKSFIFYLNDFIFVVTPYAASGIKRATLTVTKDFKTSLLTMTVDDIGEVIGFNSPNVGMTYFKGKYYLIVSSVLMCSTDGLTWTNIMTIAKNILNSDKFNFFKSTHLNTFDFVQFNNYLILFAQGKIYTINEPGQIKKIFTFSYQESKESNYCITNNTLVFYNYHSIYYTRDGINWATLTISDSSDYYFISAIEYKIDCGIV